MSQVKGAMVLQSPPEGQHTTDLASLNSMHSEPEGQQKFAGRFEWLQDWKPGALQLVAALGVISI